MRRPCLAALALILAAAGAARAEEVGEVDTAFKLLGANHKIFGGAAYCARYPAPAP